MSARKPLSSVLLIALFAAVLLFGYTTLWSSTAAFSDVTDNAGNSLAAAASFSGISQEQKATATAASVSFTVTASFPAAPTADNLLVAVHRRSEAVLTPPAGWTLAVTDPFEGLLVIYYKVAGVGESADVTFTTDDMVFHSLTIFEYSGTATSSPLDQTAANDSGVKVTSVSTSTTATTTQADELIIAAVSPYKDPGSFNNTWTNGFGQESALVVDQASHSAGSRIVAATGQFETTESWTASRRAVAAIATFKGA